MIVCTWVFAAAAKPRALRARWETSIQIDGVPGEFGGEWRRLTHALKGKRPPSEDLDARALVAFGDKGIYLAADVRDDKIVGGGDHVELLLGIPGGSTQSYLLYPGVTGKSRATVKRRGGAVVRGAKIVEAPSEGGYTLEALIPWPAVPKSSTVRVGYRGALFVHDADRSRRVERVLGTAPTRRYAKLPAISTEPELALGAGLLRDRHLVRPPSHNILANVAGDRMRERVLVYAPFLVVLGPHYRGGREYFYRDLGTDHGGTIGEVRVRDVTGDRRADIWLRKWVTFDGGKVEVLQVLSFMDGDTPELVLDQEVGLVLDKGGSVHNDVRVRGVGRSTRVTIRPGKNNGMGAAAFRYESNNGAKPLLLPWGTIKSRTYAVKDGRFEVLSERRQAVDRPPPPPPPPL